MSKLKNLFLFFSLFLFAGLSLNSYAGPFETPDVTGGNEANAIAIINADDNFEVGSKSTDNDSTAAGTVFDQSPAAGTLQDKGTAINYVVSLGPTTTTTTTTTTTAAPTTTTTTAAPTTTTTTAAPTTTTTTAAPTTTTTAAGTTTTTAAGTTTTTMGGGTTTTTATPTTTTTAASTSTTSATTTTTLPPSSGESVTVPLEGSDGTVTITTGAGETISDVSTGSVTGAPSGLVFPFGAIGYTTTSPVEGTVTMTFEFSTNLPDKLFIYKVDKNGGNPKQLPTDIWRKVDARTVEVDVTDGDPLTDQDGKNGSIVDPIAVAGESDDIFDFGGGGCTISNTRSASMDPIWLFLLLAPGLGLLRRRTAATDHTRRASS